ncbi:ATP synthase subunit B [Sulfolobus acidocaldarius]|uniref:A-type ATP synthase subunit B n=3 Tax=Sulfolobus acidocaldarius TaxID=2285 RepID=A0A0U3FS82_9CREN|nr:V-type ATP synthase subunit B [Sulfolobus acidocaldarius]AGE71462.1 V-type ATP synthase subunit B [Sulfolobus acidocaldarius N8]AGE73735.1 V-type ATP synthase subunit B [Sulfolobus acidocaldarius Ron12/I]ALU30654.1 ATP synthase subunit B [Sulfolobus acidocaldarius]ALU32744.1 ATP synthase subunit B [Sulfolobus acidocaldarius]WCM36051.1 V-type ATP synthase subunit B [Sulfolobus acidocaldarius DSM 639]
MMNIREYNSISMIKGPLMAIEGVTDAAYNELIEVEMPDGSKRRGIVVDSQSGVAIVQVFEGTTGVSPTQSKVRFLGRGLEVKISEEMLGRIFTPLGEPLDNGPQVLSGEKRDINGSPLNPSVREYPEEFIQTGVSAIDGLTSLLRGQKLPIFSGSGLPANQLAAQIAKQATVRGEESNFAVVFAAIGIRYDEALFFRRFFEETGAINRVAMFVTLANDPPSLKILTPKTALTLAEYLAYEKDMHILAILIDMTNYCEALRELSASKEEVPGRGGYPGYMYTDLAVTYERAGKVRGKKGSITQMPILTMPNDDITHPIPDLTGYITEGQIVLDRSLFNKGIYPPINVLASLSRLMRDGIGEGKTRDDHKDLSNQLFAAYARAQDIRGLAAIIGEDSLSDVDRKYLLFAEQFERKFINQGINENRDIETTLDIGWEVISMLPESEISLIRTEYIKKYHPNYRVKK